MLLPAVDNHVIEVEGVVKRYSTVTAVDHVSLEVRRGEVFALLGPNGAGKTSLVRMLVGITRPDEGEVRAAVQNRLRLGYLPEDRGLYKDVPILRTLEYFGVLHGMTHGEARREATRWLERLGLGDRHREKLDALSKGNQQKVQFVSALLHRPEVAILDEPFGGLDPLNQELLLDLIDELRSAGTTVILSAHQMNLVERLADRVHLISHGRTVLHGTISEVLTTAGVGQRYTLALDRDLDAALVAPHALRAEAAGERRLFVELRDGDPIGPVLEVIALHTRIIEIRSEHPKLHDAYVAAVRGNTPAEVAA